MSPSRDEASHPSAYRGHRVLIDHELVGVSDILDDGAFSRRRWPFYYGQGNIYTYRQTKIVLIDRVKPVLNEVKLVMDMPVFDRQCEAYDGQGEPCDEQGKICDGQGEAFAEQGETCDGQGEACDDRHDETCDG